ncbi:hypothetical protein KM043_001832 [Ampulex compressa]|nr:hypothetical protein KM043_001832 [Ampulex compressa]
MLFPHRRCGGALAKRVVDYRSRGLTGYPEGPILLATSNGQNRVGLGNLGNREGARPNETNEFPPNRSPAGGAITHKEGSLDYLRLALGKRVVEDGGVEWRRRKGAVQNAASG